MKNLIRPFVAFITIFFPIIASAQEKRVDVEEWDYNIYEYNREALTASIVGHFGCGPRMSFLGYKEYGGKNYKITEIGKHAYYGCGTIESISLPYFATKIGAAAFGSCPNLYRVVLPNSLISIEYRAFASCPKLYSIDIPPSVTTISQSAFAGDGLTEVICRALIPPTIDESSFSGSYEKAVLKVVPTAFEAYKNDPVWGNFHQIVAMTGYITSIELNPSEWEGQKGETFQITATLNPYPDYESKRKLIWESSNERVATVTDSGIVTPLKKGICILTVSATDGSGVKAKCKVKVLGPEGEEKEDPSLNYLTVSCSEDEATIVGFDADETVDIVIPETVIKSEKTYSVTGISASAFAGNPKLRSITLPPAITTIEPGAFSYCLNLETINYGCVNVDASEYPGRSSIFNDCPNLKTLNILPHVEYLPPYLFWQINLDKLIIPDNVIEIGRACFDEATGLREIHIGKGTSRISEMAFAGIESTDDDEITVYCNAQHISYYRGFEYYAGPPLIFRNVTTIDFGKDVKILDDWAFYDVLGCRDIYCRSAIPPTVATDLVLDNVDKTTCVLHVPANLLRMYQNAPFWEEFNTIVGDLEEISGIPGGNEDSKITDTNFHVYTLSGILLYKDVSYKIIDHLKPGIYIVSNGQNVNKITIN